jgi:hypothetical protein
VIPPTGEVKIGVSRPRSSVRHYEPVTWFGGNGGRPDGRPARDVLSRRRLLRRGGDVGVGALVGAAVLAFGPADGMTDTASKAKGTSPAGASDERAGGVVDVRDHGAVGNGKTDDTDALQRALDAVGPDGGSVFIPAGRYVVSSTLLVRHHNTTVAGVGPGQRDGTAHGAIGSRLEASGTLLDGPMLRVQLDSNDAPVHGVTIRDLSLDGMGRATGAGIHFRSYRALIEHVFLYDFQGHGFDFQGYPHWDLYDTVIAFSQASQCGGSGMFLGDGATDMHVTSCVVYNNQDNMQLAGGGSVQVTGCHFYQAARHNVFFNGAGSRSKFANCKIEGAGANGVLIDSTHSPYSDILFTGSNFASNGRIGADTFDHFAITGPADNRVNRTVISGCSFSTKAGDPVARYFIGIGPSAQQTTVVGNNFGPDTHYGTGVIDDEAPPSGPSVIRANGGYTGADAGLIRDTIRDTLVAGPNLTITTNESNDTMTLSSCPSVRTATGDTGLTAYDGLVRVISQFGTTVTIPADATESIQVGTVMRVRRQGVGEVTLAPAKGVTTSGPVTGVGRYASYTLTKVFPDQWDVEL